MKTPFNLKNSDLYQIWRDWKLAPYPRQATELFTIIDKPRHLTHHSVQNILRTAQQYNFALYRIPAEQAADKTVVHKLASTCGLKNIDRNLCADSDSLSSIQTTSKENLREYIPYTNRPLSWHTDGYYNNNDQQIHGMLLHCVRPAASGGTSYFMDHEIAYILLRESNPAYIKALSHPQAFTIPANIQNNKIIRPAQTGPVFSITAAGNLHMRYSARQRNIIWRNDPMTQAAAKFLQKLWDDGSGYQFAHTLQTGEGIICNNVLHCRTSFTDSDEPTAKRLLFRGRYRDRIKRSVCSAFQDH